MSENLCLRRLLPWLLVCLCGSFYSGVVGGDRKSESWEDRKTRAQLRRIYTAEIGVREATDRNDGARIREYLRYVGLGEGYAYCAAFVCWSLGEAGIENPKNGWSPALFPARRAIWNKDQAYAQRTTRNKEQRQSLLLAPAVLRQQRPRPGDVFGIYFSDLQRIAHCGFVDRWDGTWCITVEANTGPDNAVTNRGDPANPIRAGPSEGVYRKRRLVRTLYCVANWIGP